VNDPCVFTRTNALAHDEFNRDLTGEGFAPIIPLASAATTVGSTASVAWDSTVGRTCAGSFRTTAVFKGYSTSTAKEVVTGEMRFPAANWSGAKALHAWIKVDPVTAPLEGIQLFVVSGSDYRFAGTFDSSQFAFGIWYEMVLSLTPSSYVDPTAVSRVGLQIPLNVAGTQGNPATAPTITAWIDDIWVEK
jgi:hypothetical protein